MVTVLWDATFCGLEELCQNFEEILCSVRRLADSEAGLSFSEPVLPIHATVLRHVADVPNFRNC